MAKVINGVKWYDFGSGPTTPESRAAAMKFHASNGASISSLLRERGGTAGSLNSKPSTIRAADEARYWGH